METKSDQKFETIDLSTTTTVTNIAQQIAKIGSSNDRLIIVKKSLLVYNALSIGFAIIAFITAILSLAGNFYGNQTTESQQIAIILIVSSLWSMPVDLIGLRGTYVEDTNFLVVFSCAKSITALIAFTFRYYGLTSLMVVIHNSYAIVSLSMALLGFIYVYLLTERLDLRHRSTNIELNRT